MSQKGKIIFILVFAVFAAILCILINNAYSKKLVKIVSDEDWLRQNTSIMPDISIGSGVLSVYKNDEIDIYSKEYRKIISEKLNKLKKNKYSFNNPLLIYNIFGTNKSGIYIYFNTNEQSYLKYKIVYEDTSYEKILNNYSENNLTTNHEYQITGLVIGKTQDIEFVLYNQYDEEIESKKVTVFIPDSMSDLKLENDAINSYEENNELYTIMGYNSNNSHNIYLYDSNGLIRGEIPINSYYGCNFVKVDNNILYNYSQNEFALINNLSEVVKTYSLNNYNLINDFEYDNSSKSIIMIANKKEDGDINNLVISLNLDTMEVKELININDMFKELKSDDDNINIDSLVLKNNELFLLSKDINSIIIFDYPSLNLKYIISNEENYLNTSLYSYVYQISNNSYINSFDYDNGKLITYEHLDESYHINSYTIDNNSHTLIFNYSIDANESLNSSYVKMYDNYNIILSDLGIEKYNNDVLINKYNYIKNKSIKKVLLFNPNNYWYYVK